VFKVYDQDNNKVIDRTEISIVLKGILKLMDVKDVDFDAIMENVMDSLDSNHDTKISRVK
jgi:hypothetical protein